MSRLTWDAAEQNYKYFTPPPLYSVEYRNQEVLTKWISDTLDTLRGSDDYMSRVDRARTNIGAYQGVRTNVEPAIGGRDIPTRNKTRPLIPINHIQDLCIQKAAKITRAKPDTSVIPPSPEVSDKVDSMVADEVLRSIKYENDLDFLYFQICLQAFQEGEAYMWVGWDPYKGELHKDWKELQGRKEKVYLEDSDGEKVLDVNGKPIEITQPIRQGDVFFSISHVWNTFFEPADTPDQCNWVMRVDIEHIEKLVKLYPSKEKELRDECAAKKSSSTINPYSGIEESIENHLELVTLYHRSGRFIDNGLFCRVVGAVVVEELRDNPIGEISGSEWGNIPVRRLTDVDVVGKFYAEPSVNNLIIPQDMYNKLTTLMTANCFWNTPAKVVYTEGSIAAGEIRNDQVFLSVKPGMTPPQFFTFPAFTNDVVELRNSYVEVMEKTFGIFSVSRGAPPPGTRAAASLYFYDEQETERASPLQKKLNKLIVDIDRLILAFIASKYKNHDGRLIKILGKDNIWMVKSFDVDSLRKSYDIRVENAPSLPQSRYARFEVLTNLKQVAPNAITDEELKEKLEIGGPDKFITAERLARFSAEFENDSIKSGKEAPDPEPYEDHLIHWQTHLKQLQAPDYRSYPEKIRTQFERHIRAHEMLMDQKAMDSPAFMQILMALPQFPVFFVRPPQPPVSGPEMMMGQPQPQQQPQPPNGPAI